VKITKLLFLICIVPSSALAQHYFQQEVNHKIDVRLNDKTHTLSAFEEIEYTNNSPSSLDTIFFHLWPNAYESSYSALGRQKMEDGEIDFHFSNAESKGYIDSLDFHVDGEKAQFEYYKSHLDIGYLILNKPVLAGGKIMITTPFRVKIPDAAFSRLGHVGESYMITQWFPKPAVYDQQGWHPMPYLNQGEFYSEFGTYDVSITVPKNYVVGATGDLQNAEELAFLSQLDEDTRDKIKQQKLINKRLNESGGPGFPPSAIEFKTLNYKQKNVHDFAWFADKRFNVLKSSVQLPKSNRTVTTWALFTNQEASLWANASEYLDSAIYYYSLWNGEYPYQQVTAVDGTIAAGGGMEYPNVTVIGRSGNAASLEMVIVHEVGHNWFYGILGSNERDHPWLDEGLNSFNDTRYIEKKHPGASLSIMIGGIGPKLMKTFGLNELHYRSMHEYSYLLNARRNLDQPIELNSKSFTSGNYGAMVYNKTALVFNYLQAYLGDSLFDHCMHRYFEEWKFKHPQPENLRDILTKVSGKNLDWLFDDLIKTTKKIDYALIGFKKEAGKTFLKIKNKGDISAPYCLSFLMDSVVKKTQWIDHESAPYGMDQHHQLIEVDLNGVDHIKIDYDLNIPEIDRTNNTIRTTGIFKTAAPIKLQWLLGLENSKKNILYYTPIIGWNKYDGAMVGLSLYNHTFPEKKLEYTLNPFFGFGSLQAVGFGDIHYHLYPYEKNLIQRITIGSNYSSFNYGAQENSFARYQKFSPYIDIDFQKKNRRSKWKHKLFFDYNFISESYDDHQMQAFRAHYELTNSQILKPAGIRIAYEQGNVSQVNGAFQDYIKTSITAKYRFNYNYKLDGISVRLFAGHFFRNNTFSSRINWQLDGQNGEQDYLYNNIFFGRNQVQPDFLSQQLKENHGGFKVPTLRGSSSWLATANLKIELPIRFLGLYADGGIHPVYIVNSEKFVNHYLYELGGHFSLIKDLVDIYIPIIMHEDLESEFVFRKVSFLQRIRFTVDLKLLNPFKLLKQIEP